MKINKRKIAGMTLCLVLGASLAFGGCNLRENGDSRKSASKVHLVLWASSEEKELLQEETEAFAKEHRDEVSLDFDVYEHAIDEVKELLLAGEGQLPDVFTFASDQYPDLQKAGVLANVACEPEKVIGESGGMDSQIISEITQDGTLCAYPSSASNGYFLYYDGSCITTEEAQSFDTLLDAAARSEKQMIMDWTSGWYLYSFFRGAGMSVHMDESLSHNVCDFNRTKGKYTGLDVVQAMIQIRRNKAFDVVASESLLEKLEQGKVCAAVNGTWNATVFQKLWGENCRAVKLPTYTIRGRQVQMGSFAGYKYVGVHAGSGSDVWAQKLARYLTQKEQQQKHYEVTGECPANTTLAESEQVKGSEPIAALQEQNRYADNQCVTQSFWAPMTVLGMYVSTENVDGQDIQELLDKTVQQIEQ